MLKKETGQLDFHSQLLEDLVREDHPYRRVKKIVNFKGLLNPLHTLYSPKGAQGIAVETGFKCLMIQFYEDLSDRQVENALKENVAMKWFCGFGLMEDTPDHSYFGKLRRRIGTKRLAELFNRVNAELREKHIIGEVFTNVYATGLISKIALWKERDKAIKEGLEKLNNDTVGKYATDKQARFGCKGKQKFWFGYKRHCSVDMKHGLINKMAVTPANVPDARMLKSICPNGGMVLGDKGYSTKAADKVLLAKGCHNGIIRKNNDKRKDRDKDRWLSGLRASYEGTFSKMSRRTRYRGIAMVQFQAVFEALVFNIKRLVKMNAPPDLVGA
jgi:IS5 family transposase